MHILTKFRIILINFLIIGACLALIYGLTFAFLQFFGLGCSYKVRRCCKLKTADKLVGDIGLFGHMNTCKGGATNGTDESDCDDDDTSLSKHSSQSILISKKPLSEDTKDRLHTLMITNDTGKLLEMIRFRESDYQRALKVVKIPPEYLRDLRSKRL